MRRASCTSESVRSVSLWSISLTISLVIIQCFNIFASKAKFKAPFGKQVVSNYYNFAGILGGAVLAMFIVYVPPVSIVFGSSYRLSPLFWVHSHLLCRRADPGTS